MIILLHKSRTLKFFHPALDKYEHPFSSTLLWANLMTLDLRGATERYSKTLWLVANTLLVRYYFYLYTVLATQVKP